MSPFEVVHGYKARKPLDLLPMSPYIRMFESADSFVRHVWDLHKELLTIRFRLMLIAVIANFTLETIMIWTRLERFPSWTVRKLQVRCAGPFKVLKHIGPNAYVIDLPQDFGISTTFNIEDLLAYKTLVPILDDPFVDPSTSPTIEHTPGLQERISSSLTQPYQSITRVVWMHWTPRDITHLSHEFTGDGGNIARTQ